MPDTSVKKVSSRFSPHGEMGQKYLTSGVRVSMRLWENEPAGGQLALTKSHDAHVMALARDNLTSDMQRIRDLRLRLNDHPA